MSDPTLPEEAAPESKDAADAEISPKPTETADAADAADAEISQKPAETADADTEISPKPAETAGATDTEISPKPAETTDAADAPEGPPRHTLRAEELKKVFGKKTAVNSVFFEVRSGEIVGLLGPNGAGKTTSFYMVVGFHKPTAGKIRLDDEDITRLPMYKRARLGISYLPQEASVFKKLTVEENIWSILETRGDLSRAEKRRTLENLIEEFSIGHIRKQYAFTLSGGERRRTEIARSLAIEPKFLLLDEPFAGIDPIAVADIKLIIRHLAGRGIGVLITDHNVRDTLEITERAYIVNKGEILVSGSQAEIIANPAARTIYLGENFHM